MISIIGGGPVGSFAALHLAKAGFDVHIFEEHEKVGLPVQCTGLVTEKFFELIPRKKEFIRNELNKVKVISPNNSAEIEIKETLLDRERFDQFLINKALDAGAQLHLSHKFINYSNKHAVFKHKNKIKEIKTRALVGADGPLSQVAKIAGLYGDRKFFVGMQATVQGSFDSKAYQTFFGSVAPGFFAWIVPESGNVARIGLATRYNSREYFQQFIQGKGKILETQAGIIPVYNHKQAVQKEDVYLIGDAAGFCKATTGGGLISGLESAKILAECIKHEKKYSAAIKKIRKQLWAHLFLRATLDKFKLKDYDNLLLRINNPRIKSNLRANNRDSPIKLMLKIMLADPRMLLFGKCLLQKKKTF